MKRIISIAFSLVVAATVFAANVTTTFTVTPGMSCQNCVNKIKTNLRYEKGVKDVNPSLDDQVVTITYDNEKTSPEKLIAAFKKIGYTAKEGTAKAATCEKKCQKAEGKCCGNNSGKCCGKGKCAKAQQGEKSCCKKQK